MIFQIDHGASNNLGGSSDSGSENSDQINPIENSAGESDIVDTPESNDLSATTTPHHSLMPMSFLILTEPLETVQCQFILFPYRIILPIRIPKILLLKHWLLIMAPSKLYLQTLHHQKKGVTELTNQTQDYPTNRRPTGTSQEPTMLNQTSMEGNSLGNQSATTASSSSEGNGSSVVLPKRSRIKL